MRASDVLIGSMSALGDLVRASRLAQGLTRDDVANATGLSPKFITHIEAGKPTAQIGKVLHLLGELGITLHAEVSVDIPPVLATKALHRRRTSHGS
ncbi:transcriptional regulator with XRE-family HTH domain [Paraburkholderia terricola]|uniref:Transcriptional regulator with XRE-family HTH domain n=2 Tax=Burkholderiaceae TaxID=119060 RepID=A0A1M6IKK3_9BURK|nr:transcriptional regulator with XRE-family HTH domain [Paraburkholderia terricola]SDN54648.1 transcriptional regulator, XRE family [Paraburkholderia sediminicola]MDR6448869.1 transcriptional regulator with XRE-family HTH domain [Paraburkholderia terricola]MDR6481935.1 transcriptional regulator with XRE-family HTH domain [Paraburkholderia terricola]MDR6490820.1 transcriptional regulator with XRE-family HTH domain [Paraburkholderia terricola]